ncbi:MAG: MBL fold metallo-hydrolase [Desulfomonile tiedjei]|uniref:MBL fold metallo-hydrolase n=1 Tax=Desulfomonile tiedjei TaxID=2358 RepID=A0A9D6Z5A7_9BACT|nr:MBL fold metallo-hydrolase [Desulfomonile tiedjei]
MKVADHFYIYLWNNPRENNCNTIFIDGKVPLLIDPGHLHRVEDLSNRMIQDGVDPTKVRVVICTHVHPDHFGGAAAFKHAKIAISREEERFVEEVAAPMYAKQGAKMPEYKIDFDLTDGDLTLGKHEFQILLTPGHSPGGVSIYWPRYKTLFPWDVVFSQSIGRVDLPGGDIKALKESVERLADLNVDLVVPGHGPAIQGADSVRSNFDFIKKAFFTAV